MPAVHIQISMDNSYSRLPRTASKRTSPTAQTHPMAILVDMVFTGPVCIDARSADDDECLSCLLGVAPSGREAPMASSVLTQIKPLDQSARNRHTQCCIDKGYQKV